MRTSKHTSGSRKRSHEPGLSAAGKVLAAFSKAASPYRWYLFGAQAVALYGVVRTSADVDVTVEVPPQSVRPFVAKMEKANFRLRVSDVDGFVATTRVLPFEHNPTGWPLDVVLAGPGLETSFLENVVEKDLNGVPIRVISPEDLVATKILAGRPKDLEDVRGLLRSRSTRIDKKRVKRVLALLEELLGQSDLTPMFEEAIRDVGRRKY